MEVAIYVTGAVVIEITSLSIVSSGRCGFDCVGDDLKYGSHSSGSVLALQSLQ